MKNRKIRFAVLAKRLKRAYVQCAYHYGGPGIGLILVLAVQLAIVGFQLHELARYEKEIARFMPTMGEPDRTNSVEKLFSWGVVSGPFFIQFMLVPLVFFDSRRTGDSAILARFCSIGVALSAWFLSYYGIMAAMGTWD